MAGHIGDMVSQHWNTPQDIVSTVRQFFGGSISLDPCDNDYSITEAKYNYMGTGEDDDGLKARWSISPNAFVNPPYGRDTLRGTSIEDWIKKAYLSYKEGMEVILLIPASTETNFWHDYIWGRASAVCFVRNRIAFPLEGKLKASSTKGSAIVYYGNREEEFSLAFAKFGYVVE